MYNIDYKNIKANYGFFLIFLVMGLTFFIIFGYFAIGGVFKKIGKEGMAECINIEIETIRGDESTTYKPTFYYKVDGKSYAYTLPYSTNMNLKGMRNNQYIYYDLDNPAKCVSAYETEITGTNIFIIIFVSIFPLIGVFGMVSTYKRVRNAKQLAKTGTLIKNLPYRLVRSGTKINGSSLPAILVEYTLPNGETKDFVSEARYDFKTRDEDGFVDLLIDLENPKNYYIDFNIDYK